MAKKIKQKDVIDCVDEYFNSRAYEMQRNRVNEIYEGRIRYAPDSILGNKYHLGIDPIDGNSESKDALIRSDGTIESLPSTSDYFYEEMLRAYQYYNCSGIVENVMTLDLTIRLKRIKEQSKLNVIKYKR